MQAEQLAREAHEGQTYGDRPYAYHLEKVAGHVRKHDPSDNMIAVAWLHDTLEDTHLDRNDLIEAGISEVVVRAVEILTRKKGEPYDIYINRIWWEHETIDPEARRLALHVKQADLICHLMHAEYIPESLVRRYVQALYLWEANKFNVNLT